MFALHYENGIRTNVCRVSGHEFLSWVEISDTLTICTISCVFVVHTTHETIYFEGLTEQEYNTYYTMLVAPYSKVGEADDNDLFVDAANVRLYNFAERLKEYYARLTN